MEPGSVGRLNPYVFNPGVFVLFTGSIVVNVYLLLETVPTPRGLVLLSGVLTGLFGAEVWLYLSSENWRVRRSRRRQTG